MEGTTINSLYATSARLVKTAELLVVAGQRTQQLYFLHHISGVHLMAIQMNELSIIHLVKFFMVELLHTTIIFVRNMYLKNLLQVEVVVL